MRFGAAPLEVRRWTFEVPLLDRFQAFDRTRPISFGGLCMLRRPHHWIWHLLIVGCAGAAVVGCSHKPHSNTRVQLDTRYATLPPRQVPPLFKDTIFEKCDLINTEPFLVNGFGVVAN